ncbi:MAG: DUF4214 domain-containing protein [Candidatus Competibacteraceae bacterium]|nr:MAG: DUF4214 domain-containing protein [Candidatus Competibacteraceae bacterium]
MGRPRLRSIFRSTLMNTLMAGFPHANKAAAWASGVLLACCAAAPLAFAATYPAPIEFRADLVKILEYADVQWDPHNNGWPGFDRVQVSAEGSTVLFNVKCEFCDPALGHKNRLFVVDPDGTGLRDISDIYPADIVNSWWSWGSQRIDDDASTVFLRTHRAIGYYGQFHWYAYDLASGQRRDAVQNPFRNVEATIDATGARFYFSPYDAGWDAALQRARKGLFFADLGGPAQQFLDLRQLPCTITDCAGGFSAINFISLLGGSAEGDHVFFAWSDSYGAANSWEIYRASLDGSFFPLTGASHYWVQRDLEPRGWCSGDGERVLYKYRHRAEDPLALSVVEVATGAERPLTWTTDLNGFQTFITRSGRYVLVDGHSGSANALHYRTLFDLEQGTERDTGSYHLPHGVRATSNITADDGSYYLTYADALYRVDLMPQPATAAPRVAHIAFDAPALLDAEDARIGVTVAFARAAGAAEIDWVILLPLVEGRELPEWGMGRAPLAYWPVSDMGWQRLFDDGTHGDAVAGDGVFTFAGIMTRKGGREERWNSWYLHHPLPATVGIRVVARDANGHYSITDSRLLVTHEPLDLPRQTAQRAYIAYYGRPADPGGLDFWSERLEGAGGDLGSIIAAFGHSAEYDDRFGQLSSVELIANLYQNLFNRAPEPAGLAYWREQYESGARSLQAIALQVLYAAQGSDLLAVSNKVLAADHFTARVRAGCAYRDIATAVGFLATVDHTAGSVAAARAAIDAYCGFQDR